MEKLFTYGTLQDPKVQERLFNRVLVGKPDTLLNYELGFVSSQGKTFNCADYKVGVHIKGIVYEISERELETADKYELDDYKRIKIELLSGTKSWVYVRA